MAMTKLNSASSERCYVCDKIIKGKCIRLLAAIAPYSNTDLPTKIGQLMGDGFMVVVSVNDNVCKRCMSLLHELDRLEFGLNLIRTELTNCLRVKYQLDDDDGHQTRTADRSSKTAFYNNEKNSKEDGGLSFKNVYTQRQHSQEKKPKNGLQDSPEILCKPIRNQKNLKDEVVLCDIHNEKKTSVVTEQRDRDVLPSQNKKSEFLVCVQNISTISTNKLNSCNNYDTGDEIGENQFVSAKGEIKFPYTKHYLCDSCSFSFDSSQALQEHKKTHHTLEHPTITRDDLNTKGATSNCDSQRPSQSSNGNCSRSEQRIICETSLDHKNIQKNLKLNSRSTSENHYNEVDQPLENIIPGLISSSEPEQHSPGAKSITYKLNLAKTSADVESLVPNISNTNKIVSNESANCSMKDTEKFKGNDTCILPVTDQLKVKCQSSLLQKTQNINIEEERETGKETQKYSKEIVKPNKVPDSTPIHSVQDLNKLSPSQKTEAESLHCKKCQKLFSNKSKLSAHTEVCSGNLNCNSYEKLCMNESDAHYHAYEECGIYKTLKNCKNSTVPCSSNESKQVLEKYNVKLSTYCEQCGEIFSSSNQLRNHKAAVHRDLHCRYCGKEILKLKTLRNHELRHTRESGEKYECVECKKIFKTKIGLQHHSAIHTGQYKYVCASCGRGFTSRMKMEEHKSKHTKEERYICDVCGRGFCFQSTYWIHRKWHDNPFPYKCNFCGRKFKHTSLLAVHKRKHTGERPYKCPHCPLTFTVGGTLKRHIILHTGVYPYNCELCKRGFTTRHKYALHLSKIHGDSKMLTKKLQPREFKMVIRDDELVEEKGRVEGSADWQNSEDPDQLDMTFKLVEPPTDEDHYEHLEGTMMCSLVPDDFSGGNMLPSRVVEIVLEEASQAIATVTVSNTESNNFTDIWYP